MSTVPERRVIHSYDTERRRVRCGWLEQSSSTKHARDVTCVICRGLLDGVAAPAPAPAAAGTDPSDL